MNLILEKEQKEQFLVNMQLPGIELMRLSLDIIEFVAKKESRYYWGNRPQAPTFKRPHVDLLAQNRHVLAICLRLK